VGIAALARKITGQTSRSSSLRKFLSRSQNRLAVQTQNRIVVAFGRTTPFCWLFTLAVLVILGWLSFWIGAKFDHPLLAVLAYLWVIWQIVSKV
jgi:hypothetical protein